MFDSFLRSIGLPPEMGFGLLDVFGLVVAVLLVGWLYVAKDTHGFVTPGYRTPFPDLPAFAKAKIYITIVWSFGLICLLVSRVA